jgi:hypothetical protein
MLRDIIDNQSARLVDSIRTMLPRSEAAHFAVSDFLFSRLEAVANVRGKVRKLRLLIGNTASRETIEQIAEGCRGSTRCGAMLTHQGHTAGNQALPRPAPPFNSVSRAMVQ